jgi:nanoRNase/pAp phosphatase (c-di-AMP/oligoRNAs hydrolase)
MNEAIAVPPPFRAVIIGTRPPKIMSMASLDDLHSHGIGRRANVCGSDGGRLSVEGAGMTAFVEACVETVAGSAVAAERRAKGKPRARKLLRLLADKRNILITTHEHPDPDAFGAALGMLTLLTQKLPQSRVRVSLKGRVGGGINEAFYRETPYKLLPWDDARLNEFDSIILIDTQPLFAYSPLPPGMPPTAVIDHHRAGRGRKPKCAFCDIRTDVGASTSIIFSYFMELDAPIPPDLAATMLYAIESDLAGVAGTPGSLDNIALSGLTLKADTSKLHRMRYVDLPRGYYVAYSQGLANAMFYDNAIFSYLDEIDSLEKPAVLADFLLRFDQVNWSLVLGIHEGKLVLSLRTSSGKQSAGALMQRLLRGIGEGGGHRTKAGGVIQLENGNAAEIEKLRALVRRRYLRALHIRQSHGRKLVD